MTLPLRERQLALRTMTALGVSESAKTAMLSVTHAPIGKGGKNWITRTAPGNTGQLPAYIQNVRNAIMRDGKDESEATEIAIGRVEDWAEGKGDVSPEVRAAAAKAIAELRAMGAKSKAKTAAKRGVKETTMTYLTQELTADELGDLKVLEAASSSSDGDGDADDSQPTVFCVKDRKKVKPTKDGKCPNCGTDLSKAIDQAKKVQEAILEAPLSMDQRKGRPDSDFAIPSKKPGPGSYPIWSLELARKALQLAGGKPEEGQVRAAVEKRWPQLKPDDDKK